MSSLETSVTLDDVFAVVVAKRVPLAPELAGYLSLEIADGTDAGSGDVDPKTVFISEEGTVALVQPKKEVVTGDAEASIRRLLTRLLDVSGSGTPALVTAARRKPGNGLPALVEELEAALIPVNRAAGRRALARLAREVKRVLLGVGRNASAAPVVKAAAPATSTAPHARPPIRRRGDEEGAPKVLVKKISSSRLEAAKKTDVAPNEKLDPTPRGEVVVRTSSGSFGEEAATTKKRSELDADRAPADPGDALTFDPGAVAQREPDPRAPAGTPPPQKVAPPVAPGEKPPPTLFGGDEVDSLVDAFGVSSLVEDNKQVSRDLKEMAGLSPTPPPPDAKTLAELTKDVGKDLPRRLDSSIDGDSVEALLALAEASEPLLPVAPPHEPDDDALTAPRERDRDRAALPKVEPAERLEPTPALPANMPPLPPPSSPVVPPVPISQANLPPSPLFGASPASAGQVPGAPAALRQSSDALPESPDSSRFEAASTPSSRRLPGSEGKLPTKGRDVPKERKPKPPARRAPRTGMAMLVFALLVLGGATAATWKFAPQVFTGRRHPLATAVVPTAAAPAAPKCKVALVLTDVPANAEILLRMGQAPVDVERMPVGTRLEFVGTAEGQAPKRTVIKAESPWDKGPDGKPRIEVPIQLDPSKAKPGGVDPWPAAEPGSQVGGSGAPGTVHVVSNVRGAEVWLLAGLGPEARIDQLRCDADIDVLLAGGPASDSKVPLRKRLHVSDKDIAGTAADPQGNKVVNLSAK